MPRNPESTKNDLADNRDKLRAEIEKTRLAYHELLGEVAETDLTKPSLNPAWNIAEVLYHMTLAPKNLPSDVRLIRRLKWVPKIPAGPFNRLNVYFTRRGARNATKESLAIEYDQAHQRTRKVLESVQDHEWQYSVHYPDWDPLLSGKVNLERLFRYIKRHFDSHSADIRMALVDQKTQPVNPESRE
ncbi:MAG: DinB family protein [Chloroflexota bacterium]|nr:MAG: DinB family protein [Chloroflexota bacterium]